ncbi:MAG TPA: EAL domain-containing protein [Rubrobacteraceae bacterium]|nr:EAL domain-containing protein [Rubrobacteraceae bacterium]
MKPRGREKQHNEPAHLLTDAMRHAREAVLITTAELDPPGPEIVYVNGSFCRMTGYARAEVIGETPRILHGPKTDRAQLDRLRHQLSLEQPFDGETINYRKDGSEYVIEWYIVPLRDTAGKITHWMAIQRDVTERKVLEEQLRYQVLHDPLTGLPNRVLFMERLEHALSLADRKPRLNAVLFADLDDFKVVNDSLGHEAGDDLLKQVAQRVRTNLRSADTIARFGGDEFGILLHDVPTASHVADAAERIVDSLREPFVVKGRELTITCSLGIVLAASSREPPNELMRKADVAMYEAKREGKKRFAGELMRKADIAMYGAKGRGKARYQMFDPGMNTRVLKRFDFESDLKRGLERAEFVVYYQPKVSLKTGNILGLEALVRWEHPELGLVPPSEFIPVAENTGVIVDIDRWVLQETCVQVRRWQDSYPSESPLRACVNLSARQFYNPDLAGGIAEVVRETGLDSKSLELEITETVVMKDAQATLGILESLRALGVGLAIDDFGTGYSSLAYLKRFPVDTLKIDRLFVAGLDKSVEDEVIVAAMIRLAQGLGLTSIPEGVETLEQLRWLRKAGCDAAQGFYFSRPLPTEAVDAVLRRNNLLGGGP